MMRKNQALYMKSRILIQRYYLLATIMPIYIVIYEIETVASLSNKQVFYDRDVAMELAANSNGRVIKIWPSEDGEGLYCSSVFCRGEITDMMIDEEEYDDDDEGDDYGDWDDDDEEDW